MNWLTVARYWRAILVDEARLELEAALNGATLDHKDEKIIRALELLMMARSQSRLSCLSCLTDFRETIRRFKNLSSCAAIDAQKSSAATSTTDESNAPL